MPGHDADHLPLVGDWSLWREFAVRSAGFPVSGLEVFGPGDESKRLSRVARDPRFQEAVTWQNPAALANAVVKVAEPGAGTRGDRRQLLAALLREERHDRLLRATGVGSYRRRQAAAARAVGR